MTMTTTALPAWGTAFKPSAGPAAITRAPAISGTSVMPAGAGAAVLIDLSVAVRKQLASLVLPPGAGAAGSGRTATGGAVRLLDRLV